MYICVCVRERERESLLYFVINRFGGELSMHSSWRADLWYRRKRVRNQFALMNPLPLCVKWYVHSSTRRYLPLNNPQWWYAIKEKQLKSISLSLSIWLSQFPHSPFVYESQFSELSLSLSLYIYIYINIYIVWFVHFFFKYPKKR